MWTALGQAGEGNKVGIPSTHEAKPRRSSDWRAEPRHGDTEQRVWQVSTWATDRSCTRHRGDGCPHGAGMGTGDRGTCKGSQTSPQAHPYP